MRKGCCLLQAVAAGACSVVWAGAWIRTLEGTLGWGVETRSLSAAVLLLLAAAGCLFSVRAGEEHGRWWKRRAAPLLGLVLFGLLFPWFAALAGTVYPLLSTAMGATLAKALCLLVVLSLPGWLGGRWMGNLLLPGPAPSGGGMAALLFLLGGAAGALASGVFLFEHLGLAAAGRLAALGLGVAVLPALHPSPRGAAEAERGGTAQAGTVPALRNGTIMEEARFSVQCSALFSSAFAGVVFFLLLTRLVSFFTGPGFALSFAAAGAFLLSAAAGCAFALGLRGRLSRPLAAGSGALVLGGLAACLVPLLLPRLPAFLQAVLGPPSPEFELWITPRGAFSCAFFLCLPGTLFLAAGFMFVAGLSTGFRRLRPRERLLLTVVALVGGGLAFPATPGFIVPVFGTKMGVVVASFMAVASGLLLFLFSGLGPRWKWPGLAVLCAGTFLFLHILSLEGGIRQSPFTDSPVFRRPEAGTFLVLERTMEDGDCTASLVRDVGARVRRLFLDTVRLPPGGAEGDAGGLSALLPAALASHPARAFVLGCGTGTTGRALAALPGMAVVEVGEHSGAARRMAEFLHPGPGPGAVDAAGKEEDLLHVLPRDGRELLACSRERYDLITFGTILSSEGLAHRFFTREFYGICAERLAPEGVFCQALPLDALPPPLFRSVLRTFVEAFPGSAFFAAGDTLYLAGFGRAAWRLSLPRVESFFRNSELTARFVEGGVGNPFSLAGTLLVAGPGLEPFLRSAPVLVDDRPLLDLALCYGGEEHPRRLAENLAFLLEGPPVEMDRLDPGASSPEAIPGRFDALRRCALSVRRYLEGRVREARARAVGGAADPGTWEPCYEKAFFLDPRNRPAAWRYGRVLVRRALAEFEHRRFLAAREYALKAAAAAPGLWEVYRVLGFLHLSSGNGEALREMAEILHQLRPFSNLPVAFRSEAARMEGREEKAKEGEDLLARSGGLAPEDRAFLDEARKARDSGKARYAMLTLDRLVDLLCRGAQARLEDGRLAWSVAAAAPAELRSEARGELLRRLEQGGKAGLRAARGLGFFHDPAVCDRLLQAYARARGEGKGVVLEALVRGGDTTPLHEVLQDPEAPPDLLCKALEIACDLELSDRKSLRALIHRLEDPRTEVRLHAYVALVHVTGLHFQYDPYAPPGKRKDAVEAWRRWCDARFGSEGR